MIDEKRVKEATAWFCENPRWQKYYDKAPTELAKRYAELTFAYSWFSLNGTDEERQEIAVEKQKIWNQFNIDI